MEFFMQPSELEADNLLPQWFWIVPENAAPLFISAFGDWVFENPNGSLSVLSMLEGTFEKVANNSAEYNEKNKSPEWCDEIFISSWYQIAIANGVIPKEGECIGWKVHPIIGGEFRAENLQVFDMVVYQSLMSQLHSQLLRSGDATP
jgi:hypothetical protein